MTPHHFIVTLAGSASQPLTTDKSLVGYYVTIQPLEANTHVAYVGGKNTVNTFVVAADNYGIYLPAPSSSIPPAPLPIDPWRQGLQISLAQIQIIGTSGEKFAVMYWN